MVIICHNEVLLTQTVDSRIVLILSCLLLQVNGIASLSSLDVVSVGVHRVIILRKEESVLITTQTVISIVVLSFNDCFEIIFSISLFGGVNHIEIGTITNEHVYTLFQHLT